MLKEALPFMGHLGAALAGSAGTALGAGALAAGGVAASKLYDAATKARDFKGMMGSTYNADLHEHYRDRPQQFLEAYSTLRNVNPEFSRDPMIAGTYMRRVMTDMPERAGGYLMEALQHRDKYPAPAHDTFMQGAMQGAVKGVEGGIKSEQADVEHQRQMLRSLMPRLHHAQSKSI